MSIIEADNLTKVFSYYEKEAGIKSSVVNLFHRKRLLKEAVGNVSFRIEEGELVGFLGPNGAGKTTTLKMLSGILFPTSGTARVMGYVPWERKKNYKMNFSIVMGQKSQLWWDLPANESLLLNKYIYELDDKTYNNTLDELTELLDVKELLKIQVRRLSLGERMKLELIAALIHKPRIMFLDEPTIGLDIISQKRIREFLKYYNQEKKITIMLTSHYLNDIEELCKRSVIINKGRVVYDGDLSGVNDMFGQSKHIKLQLSQQLKKEELAELRREVLQEYGTILKYDGYNVVIGADKARLNQISKLILDRLPVLDFNISDVPLEEGLEMLYKKDGMDNEDAV